MSGPDTPDYQRGTVAPGVFVGSFTGLDLGGTVYPPANSDVLWIDSAQNGTEIPSVEDADSGQEYPVYLVKGSNGFGTPRYFWIALIEFPAANGIAIEWVARDAVGWAVFAQAGGRMVYDLAIAAVMGANGAPVGSNLILVGGTDGTDYRALLTDSTGKLLTSGASFPAVYGAPGSAVPADALQVGGTDGTDLRTLLVDSSGRQLTIDQNLKNAIGALAAALPADAVLIAGSDGTDLRALLTDSTGHPLTIDQNLKLAIGVPAATTPSDAVLIAGSDGTALRALLTDATGTVQTKDTGINHVLGVPTQPNPTEALMVAGTDGTDLRVPLTSKSAVQYVIPAAPSTAAGDHPAVELNVSGNFGVASATNVLPAPGAGLRYRLFHAVLWAAGAGDFCYLEDSTPRVLAIAPSAAPTTVDYSPSGLPLATNSPVTLNTNGGTGMYLVVYTIETV